MEKYEIKRIEREAQQLYNLLAMQRHLLDFIELSHDPNDLEAWAHCVRNALNDLFEMIQQGMNSADFIYRYVGLRDAMTEDERNGVLLGE